MADTAADTALGAYLDAATLEEAERALESLKGYGDELALGDLYDELAEAAANAGDFARAVRTQRAALELGCEMPLLAREMLGWYLLKDGQRLVGEAEFDALRSELGDDPDLLLAIGNARSDAGDEAQALAAFDEALTAAKQRGDQDALRMARAERRQSRERLGLPMDDEDRLVRPPTGVPVPEHLVLAVAWFPRDEHARALETWPDLAEDLTDADAYCRHIEAHLGEAKRAGARPWVAPLRVQQILEYAEREGIDPADGAARSRLAAELHRRGETLAWPPGRNESCWCGAGRKYKRCCAT